MRCYWLRQWGREFVNADDDVHVVISMIIWIIYVSTHQFNIFTIVLSLSTIASILEQQLKYRNEISELQSKCHNIDTVPVNTITINDNNNVDDSDVNNNRINELLKQLQDIKSAKEVM